MVVCCDYETYGGSFIEAFKVSLQRPRGFKKSIFWEHYRLAENEFFNTAIKKIAFEGFNGLHSIGDIDEDRQDDPYDFGGIEIYPVYIIGNEEFVNVDSLIFKEFFLDEIENLALLEDKYISVKKIHKFSSSHLR